MTIYAETPRLLLRSLETSDLPRYVALIGAWDVARWLVSVPYPYALKDAEEFQAKMKSAHERGHPELFVLQPKHGADIIGAIGLHPSRETVSAPNELVVGYWLGKECWGQGYMSEAIKPLMGLAFERPTVGCLASTTDPVNAASQNVLRKAGFDYQGISPRKTSDTYSNALRGSIDVTRWKLTREDYKRKSGS